MSDGPCEIRIFDTIGAIRETDWARLVNQNFPFNDHAFLLALESSKSVGDGTGWSPHYISVWEGDQLQGLSYLYSKTNSYGEYIFDWSWAEAFHRHGVPYYPKLTAAVPFTPATGAKLLFAPSANQCLVASILIKAAKAMMKVENQSSLHYLFITQAEIPFFEAEGLLIRHSYQYRWKNNHYTDFNHFLGAFKTKRKKQILREREQLRAESPHLVFRRLSGADLKATDADTFYKFYLSTIEKMRAIPYLTADFFNIVFEKMADEIVLILAEEANEVIAGALYYKKGDQLFGRYWGATKEVRNLHFEMCYYQPIEWAIAQKLGVFEAGAQGEHKMSRGLLPELTFSAHWIEHPEFRRAITHFVEEEKIGIHRLFEEMKPHHPFLDK